VCRRAQTAAGYGRMTGWGQDGPPRRDRRAGHRLHSRSTARLCWLPGPASARYRRSTPAWRIRRRGSDCSRSASWPLLPSSGGNASGRGPGGGSGDGGRIRAADCSSTACGRWGGGGAHGRTPGGQPAWTARAPYYTYQTATAGTWQSRRWNAQFTRHCCPGSGWPAPTCRSRTTARVAVLRSPITQALLTGPRTRGRRCSRGRTPACAGVSPAERPPSAKTARWEVRRRRRLVQPAPAPRFGRYAEGSPSPPPRPGAEPPVLEGIGLAPEAITGT